MDFKNPCTLPRGTAEALRLGKRDPFALTDAPSALVSRALSSGARG